jgi:ComF family protein
MDALLDILFPLRATERLARKATLESLSALAAPRILRLGEVSALALLPYRAPSVRALILEAKFRGNRRAQRLLGTVLANHLADALRAESLPCRLIPIPLGARRRQERGYNQVEEIARAACRALPLPIRLEPRLLARVIETRPQTELGKDARRRNIAGVFRAQDLDPAYLYILIDDVLTTGATLREAAQALTAAGGRSIWLVALAH